MRSSSCMLTRPYSLVRSPSRVPPRSPLPKVPKCASFNLLVRAIADKAAPAFSEPLHLKSARRAHAQCEPGRNAELYGRFPLFQSRCPQHAVAATAASRTREPGPRTTAPAARLRAFSRTSLMRNASRATVAVMRTRASPVSCSRPIRRLCS